MLQYLEFLIQVDTEKELYENGGKEECHQPFGLDCHTKPRKGISNI